MKVKFRGIHFESWTKGPSEEHEWTQINMIQWEHMRQGWKIHKSYLLSQTL